MKAQLVRSSILMMALVAVAVVPMSALAQGVDTSTVSLTMQPVLTNMPSVGTGLPVGPAALPVGVTRAMSMAPVMVPAASLSAGENVGKTRAMMGVGLAAIVIGIIAGGDIGTIFIVGGAVVGLIGLYRYMQ
jgi:hypothetical protein